MRRIAKSTGFKANMLGLSMLTLLASSFLSGASASETQLSGYFNGSYTMPSLSGHENGYFNVDAISVIMQHDVGIYKFLTELEYSGVRGAPAFNTTDNPPTAQASHPLESGELAVERGWAQLAFSREFTLRIGKDLAPTLWWSSHYPNLVETISRPMIVDTVQIFHENYVGLQAFGKLGAGFGYHVLLGNSSTPNVPNPTASDYPAPGFLEKIDWDSSFGDFQVHLAALAAQYHDNDLPAVGPMGFEMSLEYQGFKLWSEFATASNQGSGFYGVASYDFNIGDGGLLGPFFMYDSENITAEPTTRNNITVGLNYRPIPTIVTKVEFISSGAFTDSASADNTLVPANSQLAVSFAYFFK